MATPKIYKFIIPFLSAVFNTFFNKILDKRKGINNDKTTDRLCQRVQKADLDNLAFDGSRGCY